MKPLCLVFTLAVVLTQLDTSPASAQGDKRPARALMIHTPNGWFLHLHADGSGTLQYGSSAFDNWAFKAGTFDADKVVKDLKALPSDEKGRLGSHFVYHFESERKGDKGPPAQYTRDAKVILALYEKATDAAQVKKHARGAMLLEKHPPGLPKDR